MSIANAARPIHRLRTFTAFSQSRTNLKEPEQPERQNPVKHGGSWCSPAKKKRSLNTLNIHRQTRRETGVAIYLAGDREIVADR